MDLQELLAAIQNDTSALVDAVGDPTEPPAAPAAAPGTRSAQPREASRFVGPNADPAATKQLLDAGIDPRRVAARGGLPMGGDGYSTVAGPGWKRGHWSEPFAKAAGKALTPSGGVSVPALSDGLVPINDRALRILDVIPVEPLTGTNSYGFLREEKRVHKAAETAQGTKKPTSEYELKLIEDTAKTIAHLSEPIQRQILDDTALLRPYVDDALRQGVLLRLDSQILLGDGIGENLTGLGADANRLEVAWTEDILKTARKALTKLEDQEIYTGVFVFAPAVWELIEQASTTIGDYYLGGPVNRAERKLWGAPVIVTGALSGAATRGFLVDFAGSTRLYERETVRIDWSEAPTGSVEGSTAFETNEVLFRGEGRFGFASLRGRGIVEFPTEAP